MIFVKKTWNYAVKHPSQAVYALTAALAKMVIRQ